MIHGRNLKQHSMLAFTCLKHSEKSRELQAKTKTRMVDWAPILIGVLLFILLSPGLLFQLPGSSRHVEFGSFTTNGKAVLVHTAIFFGVFTILILALNLHIYTG